MYEDNRSSETNMDAADEGRYAYAASPEVRKEKKGLTAGKIIALALVCSLLGGILGAGGMFLATRGAEAETLAEPSAAETPAPEENSTVVLQGERETAIVSTATIDTSKQMTAAEVYAANVNSAVGITTSVTATNYWGYQSTYPASGSGFILTSDGYILTNYHVIEDSSSVTVTTYDNQSYEAEIVGYDRDNDIAVLKIDAKDLVPVVLGDSDSLHVGDTVLTIGNPLGELTFSLTQGVVSALNREVTFSSGSTMALIQTDAAINSGNSGGPLFDLHGEVVGITNAKYSSSGSSSSASIDNIGFAIPIDRVRSIVESIIENGYISHPYIGVSVATVTSELQSYGIPQGAALRVINEDSPAQAAGLQVNDVITAVDGKEITSSSDLVDVISRCQPGDVLTLTVYRQSEAEALTITITVGEQKVDALAPAPSSQQSQQGPGGGYGGYSFPFGYGFGNW